MPPVSTDKFWLSKPVGEIGISTIITLIVGISLPAKNTLEQQTNFYLIR